MTLQLSIHQSVSKLLTRTALLLLQAEPRLSPLGIKRALLATVTDDAQAHPLEQGRGSLNVQLALELTARFSEARSESAADVLIRKPVRSLETNASRLMGFPTKSMTDGAIWADDRWGAMWADDRWGAMWADDRWGAMWADSSATLDGDD